MRKQTVSSRLFVRGVRITIALLLLVSGLLAGVATPVFALDPVQTVPVDGGHTMAYYGAQYDELNGHTTYFYAVTSGASPALSHIVLELECAPPVEASFIILDAGTWGFPDMDALNSGGGSPTPSQFPASPSPDGSTGINGIKFDQGLDAGETLYFYFRLEGGFPPGAIKFVVKAGTSEPQAWIPGPGCVVPGAVTVSSFEVLRDNDTLRFKWTTETEYDNRGFDLFAVEPGSTTWQRMNDRIVLPQGVGVEPQEYYFQVDKPGLAVGADFYLRAYDLNRTFEDFGPVQAIYSAAIPNPGAPAPQPPVEPAPTPPTAPSPAERPIVEPRTEMVPLPEPVLREQPARVPALPVEDPVIPDPVVGPVVPDPVPAPVMPRLDNNLRPGPIAGSRF